MELLPKFVLTITFTLAVVTGHRAIAGEPVSVLAQASGGIVATTPEQDADGAARLNPEQCTRCYEQLQKDNDDCESLKGQDWTICREAATSAYRQCSQGC
jgi:hypothetical protein